MRYRSFLRKSIGRGIRLFVKTFPNLFKGKKVLMSDGVAISFLNSIYPDIKSSCWTSNQTTTQPQYDLHIITSAYNVEKYINQCVDSILNQKTEYTYFLTIVNDGSTDSTQELLHQYESRPNIEIINQSNKGYSGARNTALNNIKGKYLMFVDSDDFLSPDAIQTLLHKAFTENADIVQGSFNNVDEEGRIIDSVILRDYASHVPDETDIRSQPWGKVFQASLFKNICFPKGYWYEDTITKFIIVPNSNLKISLSQVVYNYRHHSGTTISQNKNPLKEIDALYVTNRVLQDYLRFYRIDDYIYNHFLHQGKFIYDRMLHVPDEKIRISVFLALCDIYHRYFGYGNYKVSRLPIIKKSLEERDYKLYCIGCKLYT